MSSVDPQCLCEDDAAVHPRLPAPLTSEMSRLFSAGYSLVPLGGPDGKKPIVEYRNRKRLPLSLVVDRMAGAGSRTFGLRCKGLLVVDVDTDTPEAREYVERRFGSSPVRIRTKRGFHLYFRHAGQKPKQVRLPNIAIDFKSGENEFVVGPKSERPDGVIYVADGPLVAFDALPWLEDRDDLPDADVTAPAKVGGRYQQGVRHNVLKRQAHQLALTCETFADLFSELLAFREREIERPVDFSDARLEDLARWFWLKRERGELWSGQNSVFQVHRSALDELASRGAGLAFLLHGILVCEHGHKPGERFAIVPDALRENGRLNAGRRQIYAAIHVLEELGLIHCVAKPLGNRNHFLYELGSGRVEGERGERSNLILVSGKDTHPPHERDELAA